MNFENIVEIIKPFADNHIFYIGQTDDPTRRITEHYKSKKVQMLIPLCKSNKSVIDSYEQKLIKEFAKHKNNMNLMVKINPKESNSNVEMNNGGGDNDDQYVYIAFKDILVLDGDFENDALIIKKVNNRIKVVKYCERDSVEESTKHTITYDEQLQQCIDKINPYILQNSKKYQMMHIGKCNDYNAKKVKLNSQGITNVKMIKKLLKNNENINQLKFDLCKHYENNENIKLENKNTIFNKIFKGNDTNNTIYIYFK